MESVNRIHVYIFEKFCSSYVNCLQRWRMNVCLTTFRVCLFFWMVKVKRVLLLIIRRWVWQKFFCSLDDLLKIVHRELQWCITTILKGTFLQHGSHKTNESWLPAELRVCYCFKCRQCIRKNLPWRLANSWMKKIW